MIEYPYFNVMLNRFLQIILQIIVRPIGICRTNKLKVLVFLYSCFDIDMDEQTSKTIPRTKHTHPQMVSN